MPNVAAVPIQTLSRIQIEITYRMIAAAISLKSPREKEKRMMNVKQHTIAGPRSPNTRNNNIVTTIAASAKKKKENRFVHVVYSDIIFSFAAKKPARKIS